MKKINVVLQEMSDPSVELITGGIILEAEDALEDALRKMGREPATTCKPEINHDLKYYYIKMNTVVIGYVGIPKEVVNGISNIDELFIKDKDEFRTPTVISRIISAIRRSVPDGVTHVYCTLLYDDKLNHKLITSGFMPLSISGSFRV